MNPIITMRGAKLPAIFFNKKSPIIPPCQSQISNLKSQIPPFPLRSYQQAAFNSTNGLELWLWARQTGKSHTLAAWAIHRLLTRPGRLVTILSNSKNNGIELNRRCAELCQTLQQDYQQFDHSPDTRFESFNTETRITIGNQVGRILVLAANPRTARGFSGDLILDEFAFHENAQAIWEAAEPILASNPDFFCRIASTPNGKHNYFYQLATSGYIPVIKVTRTDAWSQGCPVFHPVTRQQITPAEARALAPNKPAYDQNYECSFTDTTFSLLTHELISTAEHPGIAHLCHQNWSPEAIQFLQTGICQSPISNLKFQISNSPTPLYAGIDVARHHDLTVITVLSREASTYQVRAILRLQDMRLPDQQQRLAQILSLPNLVHAKIDITGLGLGLFEYTQQKFPNKIYGLNFAATVPLSSYGVPPSGGSASVHTLRAPHSEIRNGSVRITEYLATQLLQTFEDRAIKIPIDPQLRDDLRKPERIVSPSGNVSIAAARDNAGHADHFWSLALALEAAKNIPRPPYACSVVIPNNFRGGRAPRRHKFRRDY